MNITIFYDKIIVLCRIIPKKKVYNIYSRGIFDSGTTENSLASVISKIPVIFRKMCILLVTLASESL